MACWIRILGAVSSGDVTRSSRFAASSSFRLFSISFCHALNEAHYFTREEVPFTSCQCAIQCRKLSQTSTLHTSGLPGVTLSSSHSKC